MYNLLERNPVVSHNQLNFVKWYLHGLYSGETDSMLVLHSDEVWFYLGRYKNSQNNSYYGCRGLCVNLQLPLHNVMFGVWCALNATRIVGSVVFLRYRFIASMLYTF